MLGPVCWFAPEECAGKFQVFFAELDALVSARGSNISARCSLMGAGEKNNKLSSSLEVRRQPGAG